MRRSPLTGLEVPDDVAERPAVAVVVDGTKPHGLSSADIIVEEISNVPRWVGIFQSKDADVGPVASTRPVDPVLLSVLKPVYAFDGGSRGPMRRLSDATFTVVNAAADRSNAFSGSAGNLTADTGSLRKGSKALGAVPLLNYVGPDADPATGMTSVTTIRATTRSGFSQSWAYAKGKGWASTDAGPVIRPANLIFQYVDYKPLELKHPDAGTVPSAKILGEGVALVATEGKVLDARWRKSGVGVLTTYASKHGMLARLVPGQTLIVLVPSDASVKAQ